MVHRHTELAHPSIGGVSPGTATSQKLGQGVEPLDPLHQSLPIKS